METGRKQKPGHRICNNTHSGVNLCQNEIQDTDLPWHPQLEADVEAFKKQYSESGVFVREYLTIDEVDVDLIIKSDFLNVLVTKAWKINSSEPIIIRLHFSLSQYLDGPAPTVEVFQPSNRYRFCIGKQLQNILTTFINHEWRNLTNEKVICHQKRRHSWFRPSGTIKKFRARLNIWLPSSKSNEPQGPNGRSRIILPSVNLNRFSNTTASYAIKNPTGELFAYTPTGKRVMVSAVKSSTQLSTKQLIELLFSTQAIRHCKAAPTLQHGFLVQIMKYAEQRLLTLNEYCVICDERHVFQNGPMLKPAVCTRELCVFSFYTLGLCLKLQRRLQQVIDLLVAMCRAALQSKRKSIIFEPYPSIVDPCNPKHSPSLLRFVFDLVCVAVKNPVGDLNPAAPRDAILCLGEEAILCPTDVMPKEAVFVSRRRNFCVPQTPFGAAVFSPGDAILCPGPNRETKRPGGRCSVEKFWNDCRKRERRRERESRTGRLFVKEETKKKQSSFQVEASGNFAPSCGFCSFGSTPTPTRENRTALRKTQTCQALQSQT
ncbi:hypothetical protein WMY93_023015 [Mugilogobius chulae]|uniref:Uncharacterized protein n=1 Tax=Mugilogobius chulae TaxID=88201 RepID=A0AAW0N8M8_9GOBI